ncbi:MAG: hypothetical protein OHK005_16360 [Candidatus Methylacidiphilales bacterium]
MSGLQSIVYAMEVGGIRWWITRGVLLAVWFGLAVFYFVSEFVGFSRAEAMDQAQLARQVAEGKGFTTQFIRPLAIWQLKESGKKVEEIDLLNFPDTVNPPLHPLVNAVGFKLSGVSFDVAQGQVKDLRIFRPEQIVLAISLSFLLLTTLTLYVWARWLFDDVVAVTATLFFMSTALVWNFAISGLSTMLLMFCLTAAGLSLHAALVWDEEERGWLAVVGAAVTACFLGLAAMTNYVFGWLILPLVVVTALAFSRRWLALTVVLVVFVGVCAPWWVRNITLVGHPFGLAWVSAFMDGGLFPGQSIWRSLELSVWQIVSPAGVIRDMVRGVMNQSMAFSTLCGGFVLAALAVGSILHRFRARTSSVEHWFWMGGVGTVLVLGGVTFPADPAMWQSSNHLLPFLPVLLTFAMAFLYVLLDRIQLPVRVLKYCVVAIILMIHAVPMARDFLAPAGRLFAYPPYFPPILVLTKSWSEPDEVSAGDIPWAQAWYQNRVAVWLPKNKEQFFEISDLMRRIVMVLITPESANSRYLSEIRKGEWKEWSDTILRKPGSQRLLPFAIPLPPPGPPAEGEYFLLADRPRWQ